MTIKGEAALKRWCKQSATDGTARRLVVELDPDDEVWTVSAVTDADGIEAAESEAGLVESLEALAAELAGALDDEEEAEDDDEDDDDLRELDFQNPYDE